MTKLCAYCGYTVEFIPGKSTTICRACGRENTLTKFEQQIDLLKLSEEEKARVEIALQETTADKKKLSAELSHALENLDAISAKQSSGNEKLDALMDALHQDQEQTDDTLHGLFTVVAQSAEEQGDRLDKLNALSERILSAQGDVLAQAQLLDDVRAELGALKIDEGKRAVLEAQFRLWCTSVRQEDIQRLEEIRDTSAALMKQSEALDGQLAALTAQNNELQERLRDFRQQYKKNKLEHLSALYRNAEDSQTAKRFPEAEEKYKQVVIDGGDEPEVYWRVIMCHYGLEFIQDVGETERKLTMYMPDLTPANEMPEQQNLLNSLKDTPEAVQEDYKARLSEINRIVDTYREIRFDDAYDVFISVKQNDNGSPTADSVKATDLYHKLTGWDLKVFNSRITPLRAGVAFEPQIISALMSAKVMIVVGTKPEYMEAKWVQNEWRRFQWLQKNDKTKERILFCYLAGNMRPNQIPAALNPDKQAIEEGLDSVERLKKALVAAFPENEKLNPKKESKGTDEPGKESKQETHISAVMAQLERAFLALEDGKWDSADRFCENVLNVQPRNADAYLAKLMIDLKVKNKEALYDQPQPFDQNDNYKKVLRFGSPELQGEMRNVTEAIKERNETAVKRPIYENAQRCQKINTIPKQQEAIGIYQTISGWSDVDKQIEICKRNIEQITYDDAKQNQAKNTIEAQNKAIELFNSIPEREGVKEQIEICRRNIEQIKAQQEIDRKNGIYKTAMEYQAKPTINAQGRAIDLFGTISGWRDAEAQIEICRRNIEQIKAQQEIDRKNNIYKNAKEIQAKQTIDAQNKAIELFISISGWRDAEAQIEICRRNIEQIKAQQEIDRINNIYKNAKENQARQTITAQNMAIGLFNSIPEREGVKEQIEICRHNIKRINEEEEAEKRKKKKRTVSLGIAALALITAIVCLVEFSIKPNNAYQRALEFADSGDLNTAIEAFSSLGGFKDSKDQAVKLTYQKAKALRDEGKYDDAITLFEGIEGYEDSDTQIKETKYQKAKALRDEGKYDDAITLFEGIEGCEDSDTQIKETKYQKAKALIGSEDYDGALAILFPICGYSNTKEQIDSVSCKSQKHKKFNV